MTREEWQMQMLILTHEESDAERYNAALHTLEAWDIAQRMKAEQQAKEIARLRDSERKLTALEAAGVDNWEGYSDAIIEMLREKEEHP